MKLITGILIGMVLICSIFVGSLSTTSAAGQTHEVHEPTFPDENTELDGEGILDSLKQIGSEIEDRDITEYYQLLMKQYELVEDLKVNDNMDPLPDIKKIVQLAASLPLREAGKNIQDKDISRFYHDFLDDVGWDFD